MTAVAGSSDAVAGASKALLRRATFGLTPALVSDARRLSDRQWLEGQLDAADVEGAQPELDALLARFGGLSSSSTEIIASATATQRVGNWDAMQSVGRAAIVRAIWSERQLFERMIDFWSNHFNVTCPSDNVWATRADLDASAIRPNALGTFRDLLRAVIHHAAMLIYLNNDTSMATAPNENLGRELLELHTVGLEAGYSEADVLGSTRILTGLSQDWTTQEYVYRPSYHWVGAVTVLDFSSPNVSMDGRPVIAAYLDHLARHPATARRIATKLVVHFVADSPPAALVERLAALYLKHDTAIKPMLIELFTSPEFAAAADQKVRRPFESVVAAARALGIRPPTSLDGISWLYWSLNDLNHLPLAWAQPDGYPEEADAWRSSAATLTRMNIVTALAGGWQKSLIPPSLSQLLPDPLPDPLPATHGELIGALHERLHLRGISDQDVLTVCTFLRVKPSTPVTADSAAVTWQLPTVVAVLLNSPALMIY
jgi:uncharacterized protein (DUF1800 family)